MSWSVWQQQVLQWEWRSPHAPDRPCCAIVGCFDGRAVQAYVTGLEAANEVIVRCGKGESADIEPLAVDEPHVAGLAAVQNLGRQLQSSLSPLSLLLSNALSFL